MKKIIDYKSRVPHIIKYMGSKRELLPYLIESIEEIHEGEIICDLFAGTSVLSGALSHKASMHSNDIQTYSSVLANTYLIKHQIEDPEHLINEIIKSAQEYVKKIKKIYPKLVFEYNSNLTLTEFQLLEKKQQELISKKFNDLDYYLFIKYYSGTYWSFEQSLWIDAIRKTAENYKKSSVYFPILSSLMFAMAYNAQSTGHYAQYRDAHNEKSMQDIILYRNKEIKPYFEKKLRELLQWCNNNNITHTITSLDYRECLNKITEGTLVYADPPYAFVHYSRFYHVLETLVRYDYPKVLYKGRYRTDRHQSPFCKRTEVKEAFIALFNGIKRKKSKLILSYSNTGMIALDEILDLAKKSLHKNYDISYKALNYIHSTMGRLDDKSRNVKEYLIIAIPV